MEKEEPDRVVEQFSRNVREKAGSNLKHIVLFGSRARGDHFEHSDYDFLIILYNDDSELRDHILDIEVDMMNRFGVLVSSLVFSDSSWNKRRSMPLGLNIQKEGIRV